jgi:hypothetical protein
MGIQAGILFEKALPLFFPAVSLHGVSFAGVFRADTLYVFLQAG